MCSLKHSTSVHAIIFVCNIKYKLKQQISAGRTKCYNIVWMAAKAAAFQLRRSAARMQLVGCATFRNSCGHFEHAGLARNVNRKYSVSPDFNYEARMVIARESGRSKRVRRWKRVGAGWKEGRDSRLPPPWSLELHRGWKSCCLFDGNVAFTTKKVSRIGKLLDYLQDIGTKRQTWKNLESLEENTSRAKRYGKWGKRR